MKVHSSRQISPLQSEIEKIIGSNVEMNWTYKDDTYLTGIEDAAEEIMQYLKDNAFIVTTD